MLRLATTDDLPDILRMARAFHEVSPYRCLPFDSEYVSGSILHTLGQPESSVIILGLDDGKIVGMLAGIVSVCILNGKKQASESVFWVDAAARKSTLAKQLKEAYEYWAKNVVHCDLALMSALEDDNLLLVDKLYKRSGYTPAERNYMKVF